MNILSSTTGVCATILAAWHLAVPSASADPYALGYDAYPLATINWARGVDRRGDQLIGLGVKGELVAVEQSGQRTTMVDFNSGTWIGPAVNPETDRIYASIISANIVVEIVGSEFEVIAPVYSPAGLAFSEDGSTLYVSSYRGHRIYAIDMVSLTVSECADSHYPDGLDVWNGALYVANRGDRRIDVVALDEGACGTSMPYAQGGFSNPVDIAGGDDGLFVADFGNGTIYLVADDLSISEFAVGFNGPAGVVTLGEDLFVAEYNNNRLWMLTASSVSGTVSGLAPPISVLCQNVTSGQEVEIILEAGVCEYNCTLAGFNASDGDLININIQALAPTEPSGPSILEFTFVPPIGSTENLEGLASPDGTEPYEVATYIKVSGGWWTKPYWAYPTVPVMADGTFVVDITTGGIDTQATDIVAYLILARNKHRVPARGGQPSLPSALENMDGDCDDIAVAKANVVRAP